MPDSDPFKTLNRSTDSQFVTPAKPLPSYIGRYRIEKILGEGGFGRVYLAQDEQLRRPVAIKVPHSKLVSCPEDVEAYLAEAQALASLDHPCIVTVHDVGSTQDFPCYFVSKYIDGADVSQRLTQRRFSCYEAAEIAAAMSDALHYAHTRGLVHRDVKPGNILIDRDQNPYLVDFGLALKDSDYGLGANFAGTPHYMSPEQARGEGHRVDGRSDIYSLGAVLYELLVGRRPFRREDLSLVGRHDPKPPRQIDDSVPKELERICLKALAQRASDRYTTAHDMAEDLRHFLMAHGSTSAQLPASDVPEDSDTTQARADTSTATPDSHSVRVNVVPKGLRSFDKHDADFFLELLPGPRDRHGLPDSLRFWKTRIDSTDAHDTFPVGMIYGPSGCGKSSLVKAGLLPRLAGHVTAIYLEATVDETETTLLNRLRAQFPSLSGSLDLMQAMSDLRRGQIIPADKKVLIVVDQFEQWLHAKREVEFTELIQALRQCDGARVQCIVMVRDDFWMAATRFMRELEVPLVEGENSHAVDLFPIRHARRVLSAFGRAFGDLPEDPGKTSKKQREFIQQAVDGVAEEGKVVCVRLALFAEMMRGKPWAPATLKQVGGTQGVRVAFLEETFSASTAPPDHRYHQRAARAVLKLLLPESAADIKGHMRSYDELLAASGYAQSSRDFEDLIRILDDEVRLITPADPEGVGSGDQASPCVDFRKRHYQLSHDYIVPSLREWLTRKQKETHRGRAELRLQERASYWRSKPKTQLLPPLWEYLNIRLFTDSRQWSQSQRTMMKAAARQLSLRWGGNLAAVVIVGLVLYQFIAAPGPSVESIVDALENSRGEGLPLAIANLQEPPREPVIKEMRSRYRTAEGKQKLALAYGLAQFGEVDHDLIVSSVSTASSCVTVVSSLQQSLEHSRRALSDAVAAADRNEEWRLKARLAVVCMHLGDLGPATDMLRTESRPNPIQRTLFIDTMPRWHADPGDLIEFLQDVDYGALCSGMCLVMGSIPANDLRPEARDSWRRTLQDWFTSHPAAGTHSAAGWALRQWKIELPQVRTLAAAGDSNWRVTPMELTMVKIPAGQFVRTVEGQSHTVKLPCDFFLSDREITVGLFQQFIEDPHYDGARPPRWDGVDPTVSPTAEHPVQQVNWNEAVMFCNWLSRQDGLRPCYQQDRKQGDVMHWKAWQLIEGANGYRLPTEAEWEYACRAGTTTRFAYGDHPAFLDWYCAYDSTFDIESAEPVASKLCNAWGLFDMHGNVWEWCQGWYEEYPTDGAVKNSPPERVSDRVYRGGSCLVPADMCRSDRRQPYFPSSRHKHQGFRVAAAAPCLSNIQVEDQAETQ